jgi:hypothetical protein
MEFTIEPKLRVAYDEIVKVQGYQNTFKEQLSQTNDPVELARIQTSMEQNQRYLQQQAALSINLNLLLRNLRLCVNNR